MRKPLATESADRSSSILIPTYDADTGLLFLHARGERNVRVVDVGAGWAASDELRPELAMMKSCSTLNTGTEALLGLAMLPKRVVDVKGVEVDRLVQLTTTNVSVLPVTVPRAAALKEWFQDDLYPPAMTGAPALDYDAWKRGENAEAPRESMQPDGMKPVSEKPVEVKTVSSAASNVYDMHGSDRLRLACRKRRRLCTNERSSKQSSQRLPAKQFLTAWQRWPRAKPLLQVLTTTTAATSAGGATRTDACLAARRINNRCMSTVIPYIPSITATKTHHIEGGISCEHVLCRPAHHGMMTQTTIILSSSAHVDARVSRS